MCFRNYIFNTALLFIFNKFDKKKLLEVSKFRAQISSDPLGISSTLKVQVAV